MPIFKYGDVEVYYEEAGDGEPLLVIPGGGLNATVAGLTNHAFNPLETLSAQYRCIALDLRHAINGRSSGPLDVERPWDSLTDDQLALMDHFGVDTFSVLGFCIGGPLIWNLLRRAGERVKCAVLTHPSGFRSDRPSLFFENNMSNWAPGYCAAHDDITMNMAEDFLSNMYRSNPDFVFTVSRDFVRQCDTPILVLPDDIGAHPYAVAMESALLAPNSQVSIYPWKEDPAKVRIAHRHIEMFLNAHR